MIETVTVYTRSATGEDANGDPIEIWDPTEADALVYELSGSDLKDADLPDGTSVRARVQFQDSFMAEIGRDGLRGCKVALTGRGQTFDDAYSVIGSPNYAPGLPTSWNTTVTLGRTDG